MKLWLLVLSLVGFSVLGFSVLATGQSSSEQGPFNWSANGMEQTSPTTRQLRGNVRIAAGRLVITADEADVQSGPAGAQEVILRGSVHLSIAPRP
jgi:lipopolysaccharide export system protein LptA